MLKVLIMFQQKRFITTFRDKLNSSDFKRKGRKIHYLQDKKSKDANLVVFEYNREAGFLILKGEPQIKDEEIEESEVRRLSKLGPKFGIRLEGEMTSRELILTDFTSDEIDVSGISRDYYKKERETPLT